VCAQRGDVLVVLEAMKMEQPLVAAAAGRVSAVRVGVGEQVGAGALLVELEVGDG
jgi:biotin carboxyl carrier protein